MVVATLGSRPPRSSDRGSSHGLLAVAPQPSGCGFRDTRVAFCTISGSWFLPQSSGCGATAFGLWLSRPPGRGRHDLRIVVPATVFGLWCHSLRAVAVATPGSRPPRSSDRGSCHSLRAVVPQPSDCGCLDPRVAAATIFGSWLLLQFSGCGATAFGLWLSRPPSRGRHELRIVAPATVFGLWCHSLRAVAVATPGSRPPRSSDRGFCHSLWSVVPQLSGCGCRDFGVAATAILWCHSSRAVAVTTLGSRPYLNPQAYSEASTKALRLVGILGFFWKCFQTGAASVGHPVIKEFYVNARITLLQAFCRVASGGMGVSDRVSKVKASWDSLKGINKGSKGILGYFLKVISRGSTGIRGILRRDL